MTSDYHIRLAERKDAPGIAEIYRPYVDNSAVSFEEHAPNATEVANRIERVSKKHVWLVCEHRGEVAGYAYHSLYRERVAYRWVAEVSVYIHPNHRRKHMAKALYDALHEIMRLQGYVTSYAIMTIPNEASKRFHEEYGYRSFALFEHSGFKLGQWHTTEWFVRPIQSSATPPEEIKSVADLDPGTLKQIMDSAAQSILRNHHETS